MSINFNRQDFQVVKKKVRNIGQYNNYDNLLVVIVTHAKDPVIRMSQAMAKALGNPSFVVLMSNSDYWAIEPVRTKGGDTYAVSLAGGHHGAVLTVSAGAFCKEVLMRGGVYPAEIQQGVAVFSKKPQSLVSKT